MTAQEAVASKSTPASTKKTPPVRKYAMKKCPTPEDSTATPQSFRTLRACAGKGNEAKNMEGSPTTPEPSPHPIAVSSGEKAEEPTDSAQAISKAKCGSASRTVRGFVRRTVVKKRTPTSDKAIVGEATNFKGIKKDLFEISLNEEFSENIKEKGLVLSNIEESSKNIVPIVENLEVFMKDLNVEKIEKSANREEIVDEIDQPFDSNIDDFAKKEEPSNTKVIKSSQNQSLNVEEEDVNERFKVGKLAIEEKVLPGNEKIIMRDDANGKLKGQGVLVVVDACDEMSGKGNSHDKLSVEKMKLDELPDHGEEDGALEEERAELNAVAKERKIKKELEIFVGGLDRDATVDDVKKAFENVGEVVEVRLNKDPLTNKNKGYAFVTFRIKEQARRALSEMKNPVIRGKRCGTASSEDNDTLFLGNICNTWTKEAVKQKLKDYGIESIENITLVPDTLHEGLSRGFAFLEFSCHTDAMVAYKRLQKPDVIFGHPERTAKVAFAEPLREPDPEIMAQIKSVFIDGLPPYWDEDHVREKFKLYGVIERITLARNMPMSKRNDFGFVDFTSHEAAVACIDGINDTELGDGISKVKVKARLSNPLPKTQAVKGGMSGGFRIARVNGRGFRRGGHSFNRANFHRGRGFYQRGRGQLGRVGFAYEYGLDGPYSPCHGREQGGRWNSFRGASGGGPMPPELGIERYGYEVPMRLRDSHVPFWRQQFVPEEGYGHSLYERHFNDPYLHDDVPHGIKRPFFMTDQESEYMEPDRYRPKLGYSDPPHPIHGTHRQDTFGYGGGLYSHDYYHSDYGEGTSPSFYGADHPYGGGNYY